MSELSEYARRLQDGGVDSVVEDAGGSPSPWSRTVSTRGMAAGFAAGRLIRGAQAAGDESGGADRNGISRITGRGDGGIPEDHDALLVRLHIDSRRVVLEDRHALSLGALS